MHPATGKPSDLFGAFYYQHHCGEPYERTETWLAFFSRVADRIVADLNPRTVLDAGCAKGFLVEQLRARGVEAWGIDISEYAIGAVEPSVRAYCSVGSIAQPLDAQRLPGRFDLVVSIEVLEHMPAEEAALAIENLCRYSDSLLISTSPYDYKEATHMNVHPPEYWARHFARCGFYHDLDFDATFLTPWARRFYRLTGPLQPVIQAYERRLWELQTEVRELRAAVMEYHLREDQLSAERSQIEKVQSTRFWKLVQGIQRLRARLAPPGSRRSQVVANLIKKI